MKDLFCSSDKSTSRFSIQAPVDHPEQHLEAKDATWNADRNQYHS
jgi:hypothetical protein